MQSTFDKLLQRAVAVGSVQADGQLTKPRTFGVYELTGCGQDVRRFRMGSHPIRMIELEQESSPCKLLFLFRNRSDAVLLTGHLNNRKS